MFGYSCCNFGVELELPVVNRQAQLVACFVRPVTLSTAQVCHIEIGRGATMSLSSDFLEDYMTFNCLNCAREMRRKGSWVKSVTTFKCTNCSAVLRMTYSRKTAIFEKHRRP